MRLAPRDVRDLIISQQNDHRPSYWWHGASQRRNCPRIGIYEIFGVVGFSTFATKSAKSGHSAGLRSINSRGDREECSACDSRFAIRFKTASADKRREFSSRSLVHTATLDHAARNDAVHLNTYLAEHGHDRDFGRSSLIDLELA